MTLRKPDRRVQRTRQTLQETLIRLIFEHAAEQSNLFKAFLRPERLLQPAHQQLAAFAQQRIALIEPDLSEMEKSVQAEFVIGGLLAVLRWWIEANLALPAAEAAAMMQRLLDKRPL